MRHLLFLFLFLLLNACASKSPSINKIKADEFGKRFETLETLGYKSATCDVEMQSFEQSDVPRYESLASVTYYADNDATVKVTPKSPAFTKGTHYSLVEMAVKAAVPLAAVSVFSGSGRYEWKEKGEGYFNIQKKVELTLNKTLDQLRIMTTDTQFADLNFSKNSRGKLRLTSYEIDYGGKGKVRILLNYDESETPYLLNKIFIPEVPLTILLTNCEAKK